MSKIHWRSHAEQARAASARRLIAEGKLHPLDGIAMVVWPSEDVRQAESTLSNQTLKTRVNRDR